MKRILLKAQGKKQKYFSNTYNETSDSDGSLSENEELNLDLENSIINNKYIFISYLSRGTFSSVWLVYDMVHFEFKTAKIYSNSENYDEFSNELKMFNIINKIDNANIVRCFDIIEHNSNKIIIMELLGVSLLDIINDINEQKINLDIIHVKEIYKQILKGYNGLHNNNIIHADIKPDNILFDILPNYLENLINFITNLDIKETFNHFNTKLIPPDYDDFQKNKKKK